MDIDDVTFSSTSTQFSLLSIFYPTKYFSSSNRMWMRKRKRRVWMVFLGVEKKPTTKLYCVNFLNSKIPIFKNIKRKLFECIKIPCEKKYSTIKFTTAVNNMHENEKRERERKAWVIKVAPDRCLTLDIILVLSFSFMKISLHVNLFPLLIPIHYRHRK